jgi:NADPH:quinone reductase-like Zn-dependent oxidoreductase
MRRVALESRAAMSAECALATRTGTVIRERSSGACSEMGRSRSSVRSARRARRLGVRYSFFFKKASGPQLRALAALYDNGTLRPVLDRTFPFAETLDAMDYVEQGKANGKIVITRDVV